MVITCSEKPEDWETVPLIYGPQIIQTKCLQAISQESTFFLLVSLLKPLFEFKLRLHHGERSQSRRFQRNLTSSGS